MPTGIEETDAVELLPTGLAKAEERVAGGEEIAMSPLFKLESLEDLRVVESGAGAASTSFLPGPRSGPGAGELDKLDRGEGERVEAAASAVLRKK